MSKNYKGIIVCATFLTVLLLIRGHNIIYAQLIFSPVFLAFIIFYLARAINFSKKFQRSENNIWKKRQKQDFKTLLDQDGIFTYDVSGFTFPFFEELKKYSWFDIKTLVAYKEDMNTYDEIYLKILFIDRQVFLINETTPGWYKFLKLASKNIPEIPFNWDYEITIPPFDANMTVIFDKEKRDKKMAIKDAYADF